MPEGTGNNRRRNLLLAGIGTAFTAVLVSIIVALINAHVLFPPPPTPPAPTSVPSAPTSIPASNPTSTAPSIPKLGSTYQGTMNRVTDGSVQQFNLQQLNENTNDGTFTASSVINGCPANIRGQIKADNTLTFQAVQTSAGTCGGFEGDFTGDLNSNGSIGGQWDVPNTQVGGTWSAQPLS